MAGLTLSEIRVALRDQIVENLDRATNVYAYPVGNPEYPCVTIEPASDYVDYWGSFGSSGIAVVRYVLTVYPGNGSPTDQALALDDYLSAGTGNGSSIIDAVMSVKTLGLTGCSVILDAVEYDPGEVRLSVTVRINKVGANA